MNRLRIGIDFENYYKNVYKPISKEWSTSDLIKYKKWFHNWLKYIHRFVNLEKGYGKKVLEIGCGIGAVVSILSERGFNCVGGDISSYILERAKKLNPDISFIRFDVQEGIPIKSNLDIIIGFEVLEHLQDLDKAILNIYSKLNRGGGFIGTSPYPYKKNFLDPTHTNVKYPEEWKAIFEEKGFRDVQIKPMSFLPFLYRINKKFNFVIPFYVPYYGLVSTTLIIAKRGEG